MTAPFDGSGTVRSLPTPCVGVCSTTDGDHQCEGCGRRRREVVRWREMPPHAQESVIRRAARQGYLKPGQKARYPAVFKPRPQRRQP